MNHEKYDTEQKKSGDEHHPEHQFHIQIDRVHYTVTQRHMTGEAASFKSLYLKRPSTASQLPALRSWALQIQH